MLTLVDSDVHVRFAVGTRWFVPYGRVYAGVAVTAHNARTLTVRYLGYTERKLYEIPWSDTDKALPFTQAVFKQLVLSVCLSVRVRVCY